MSQFNIQEYTNEIANAYKTAAKRKTSTFLLYGQFGSGKTRAIATAPGPIFIYSFDPGGTQTIDVMREKGLKTEIIIDSRYEVENSRKPFAYKLWEVEFNKMKQNKVFDKFGTVAIDSGTRFLSAMMNQILQERGKVGKGPDFPEYKLIHAWTEFIFSQLVTLPCNFIFTGHIDTYQDQGDGLTKTSLMAVGGLKQKIPLMFSEVYLLRQKDTSGGLKRTFQVISDTRRDARSRIGAEGILDKEIEPDLRAVIKTCGKDWEDKPSVLTGEESDKQSKENNLDSK